MKGPCRSLGASQPAGHRGGRWGGLSQFRASLECVTEARVDIFGGHCYVEMVAPLWHYLLPQDACHGTQVYFK